MLTYGMLCPNPTATRSILQQAGNLTPIGPYPPNHFYKPPFSIDLVKPG
jgi:hypothetical protein